MPQPSPYTPGQVAREVPGRESQLADIDERLDFMTSFSRLVPRIRVDHAPRGIGKTSLLRKVQHQAEERGAATVWVTANEGGGLVPAIAAEIERVARPWSHNATSFDPIREFEDLLVATVDAALADGKTGVVFLIDEIQAADVASLRVLSYAWQHFQSERLDLPAAAFAAGLPDCVTHINEAVSNSERIDYRRLGALGDAAAAIALTEPARAVGVAWDREALEAAVRYAAGYPHTIQLVGDAAWLAAGRPDPEGVITGEHLASSRAAIEESLAELYAARLSKVTQVPDVEFVGAMAALGDGPIARSRIAAELGKSSNALSVPRARLIGAGIIDDAGRGRVEFTVPGFAAHVRDAYGLTIDPAAQTRNRAQEAALASVTLRLPPID